MNIAIFRARVFRSMAVLAALTLAGCSSVRVSADFDPAANLHSYKTFAWLPGPQKETGNERIDNPLLDKRIRDGVTRQLQLQGYVEADASAADMLVGYHISLDRKLDVTTVNNHYGYGYRGAGGSPIASSHTVVHEYETGTLIIDLVDRRKNQLVWRGSGESRLTKRPTPEETDKKVATVVAAILAKFPPAKK